MKTKTMKEQISEIASRVWKILIVSLLSIFFIPPAFAREPIPQEPLSKKEKWKNWWLPYGLRKRDFEGRYKSSCFIGGYLENNRVERLYRPPVVEPEYRTVSAVYNDKITLEPGGFLYFGFRWWGLRMSYGGRRESYYSSEFEEYVGSDPARTGNTRRIDLSNGYRFRDFGTEIRIKSPLRISPYLGYVFNIRFGEHYSGSYSRELFQGGTTYYDSDNWIGNEWKVSSGLLKLGITYEGRFQQLDLSCTTGFQMLPLFKKHEIFGVREGAVEGGEMPTSLRRKPVLSVSYGLRIANWGRLIKDRPGNNTPKHFERKPHTSIRWF